MTGDVVVGAYALRTFRVTTAGELQSLNGASGLALDDWRDGTCTATCRYGRSRHPDVNPPQEACACGVYCFRSLADLQDAYPHAAFIVAVIRLEGQVLEGTRGSRAEAARVVAIWLADAALPPDVAARLRNNLPDATFHADLPAMIAAYPTLPPASTPPTPRTRTRAPAPANPTRTQRVLGRMFGRIPWPLPDSLLSTAGWTAFTAMCLMAMIYLLRIAAALAVASRAPDLSDTRWGPEHFLQALFVAFARGGESLAAHPLGWTICAAGLALIGAAVGRRAPTHGWWLFCTIQASAVLADLSAVAGPAWAAPASAGAAWSSAAVAAFTTAARRFLRHHTATRRRTLGVVGTAPPVAGTAVMRRVGPGRSSLRQRTDPNYPVLVLPPTAGN